MSIKPTDANIVRGFQQFEEKMNVALAVLRDSPEKLYPDGRGGVNQQAVGNAVDTIWKAHAVFREMAYRAQKRIDAKKEATK